jgi:hypothetical protein
MNQKNRDGIWLLREEAHEMNIQSFHLSRPLRKAVDSVFRGFPSTVKDTSLNRTKGELSTSCMI